ncbi:UDP-glucuronosyltransferase 1-8-like [Copidosoma floridanum]|uniref:UDP-glucuronosyltransferase 1-8-like n=1 Tax=Copidosoma floridanum TaxID=29053 RepID=UPI0006C95F01|nr:UDP-glucuronosyltransferase 1-8-like [Copidosoma floridanum]
MLYLVRSLLGAALLLQLLHNSVASSLLTPPQLALIVAFEDVYDLSLLANTISGLGIETTLVVSSSGASYERYENLNGVELISINNTSLGAGDDDDRAVKLCDSFISDINVMQYAQKMQPTFVIFPGVRHDACLLPWTLSIHSIPVIWARGHYEEFYAFTKTGMALPVHELNFVQSFIESLNLRFFVYNIENKYVVPTQKMLLEKLSQATIPLSNLYSNVQLVLWGADPILRNNYSPLTQLVAEIGCHHCRGPQPLPADLQKELIEFRTGTIAVLLDENYEALVYDLAQKLPNNRQGLAVMWKNKNTKSDKDKPSNLFIHRNVDRQDIIGYPRTRLVLCHCTDSEFLESAFHGTPMVCFPRKLDEQRNALRAHQLGFGYIFESSVVSDNVANVVKEIHQSTHYRENARSASQAIRDRSSHAMDRIQFWLGYTARHYGESKNLLLPKKVSTYNETLQVIIGALLGFFFAIMLSVLFYFSIQFRDISKKKFDHKKKHKK